MGKSLYRIPHRLAEVIALIQVLAIDIEAHRRESELLDELQDKPKSATSWTQIAKEHRELFRYNKQKEIDGGPPISLIARHVTEKVNDIREFPHDLTKKLIEIAILIHDKQKKRAEWWKVWLPFVEIGRAHV